MAEIDPTVEAMLQQVQARLAHPVSDPGELDRLTRNLAGVAERTQTLSAFTLPNSDEPYSVFSVCRPEDE